MNLTSCMRAVFAFGVSGLATATFAADAPAAPPFLSPIFGDNMVLQRGRPNRFWGWTHPGDAVTVQIGNASATAKADPTGRWTVSFSVPETGGPYEVDVRGPQSVVLHNVLVGDVWLCGGQSNMNLGIGITTHGAEEVQKADHPDLRLYRVEQRKAYAPVAAPVGAWKVCTPQTLAEGGDGGFSAVAYYFARAIQHDVHVPIGLIEDCVGGSPAEAWMSPQSLAGMADFKAKIEAIGKLGADGAPEYGSFLMHWLDEYDPGASGKTWADPGVDDSTWKEVDVPGAFAELGAEDQPSVCWFRREVKLPDPLPEGDARILLGSIEKMDTTYINGKWVGASSWVENPRAYPVAAGVLKPGDNLVAIRVFKEKPGKAFLANAEALGIKLGNGVFVPIAGRWRGIVSVDARPPHPLPMDVENYATMPTVFYEGMIAPVAPLSITGAIWYQGEANTSHAGQYRALLTGLIADWRRSFGQGDFPFYIVGLPAFMHRKTEPTDDGWADLREAQALTARSVPDSGLAVTIDTGDADNIHPKEKKVVGERLAYCALAGHYGENLPFSGPVFTSAERLPGRLRLHFTQLDGGLVCHGAKLVEFSVAGSDRQWHWADAAIDGDSVVVSSAAVPDPVAARYAWQGNPQATLFNAAGLPAAPFRTDGWPLTGK